MGIDENGHTGNKGEVLRVRFNPRRPPSMTAELNASGRSTYEAKRQTTIVDEPYKPTFGDYIILATDILRDTPQNIHLLAEVLATHEPKKSLKDVQSELDSLTKEMRVQDPLRSAILALAFYEICYGGFVAIQ